MKILPESAYVMWIECILINILILGLVYLQSDKLCESFDDVGECTGKETIYYSVMYGIYCLSFIISSVLLGLSLSMKMFLSDYFDEIANAICLIAWHWQIGLLLSFVSTLLVIWQYIGNERKVLFGILLGTGYGPVQTEVMIKLYILTAFVLISLLTICFSVVYLSIPSDHENRMNLKNLFSLVLILSIFIQYSLWDYRERVCANTTSCLLDTGMPSLNEINVTFFEWSYDVIYESTIALCIPFICDIVSIKTRKRMQKTDGSKKIIFIVFIFSNLAHSTVFGFLIFYFLNYRVNIFKIFHIVLWGLTIGFSLYDMYATYTNIYKKEQPLKKSNISTAFEININRRLIVKKTKKKN